MFTFDGEWAEARPRRKRLFQWALKRRLIHWLQGSDRYKLTTPRDRFKRRMARYYIAPDDFNWPGGVVPTFGNRRKAREIARVVSSWGFGGMKVQRGHHLDKYRTSDHYFDGEKIA